MIPRANSRTTYIHLTNRKHSASNIRDINHGKQVNKLNSKHHRNDYDLAFFFKDNVGIQLVLSQFQKKKQEHFL